MDGFTVIQGLQNRFPDKLVSAYTYPNDQVVVIDIKWLELGKVEKWAIALPFSMIQSAEFDSHSLVEHICCQFQKAWSPRKGVLP